MAVGYKTGGRQKGTQNKLSGDIKAMIVGALSAVGGQTYLELQSKENPVAFMALLGKVIPLQVTGESGGAIVVRWEK